ncbi:MAG: aromatic ring-hydroxylating dioxygenase subunit alpha [Thermoleophilia bacterium]|nr:aromatic ring-hydroxylating dioxygenase subunit alpha [Thermoleophilia bacterium]MDH4346625.1 aromatic ring-hydroxylating dioxygenase subunit alpha [Thermoleophilia bacterium]MDH5334006.1 aromatic ring-hydroxylating dioxygenase subunit alpha [Thermoleophilia bacterium]
MSTSAAAVTLPPLDHPLEDGWTLPAAWYSSSVVHELELERIFARAWQYVGRADLVAEPGCFFASHVAHVPVVVVRDADGGLRGYVNVCRHRGHLVADGAGCRATLQCPYHAWTYGLDGSLLKAPRSEREPEFDPRDFSLLPVSVATWGPWVFANPDPDAAPLGLVLDGVREVVEASGVDLDDVVFRRRVHWEAPVNWKNAVENYLECYHCAVAHPGLAKVVDVSPDAYEVVERPLSTSQFGRIRPGVREGTANAPYRPGQGVESAQYHHLWPNTTINIEAGRPNVGIDVWLPAAPGRSTGYSDYFFGSDVTEEEIEEIVAFSQQVGKEDQSLVESVQAGLDSGAVPQGRLFGESERLIGHFQRRIHAALTGAG